MRTYPENFETEHNKSTKTPLYVVLQYLDIEESEVVMFTSNEACELPEGVVRPEDYVEAPLLETFIADTPVADGDFGSTVSLSDDTLVMAISQVALSPDTIGGVYMYRRTSVDNAWVLEAVIDRYSYSPTIPLTYNFGYACALSGDGNVVVVSAPNQDNIYEFKYEAGAWVWATRSQTTGNSSFGKTLAYNYDGKILVVGVPNLTTNTGRVIVIVSNELGPDAVIEGAGVNEYFGCSVAINSVGDVIYVASQESDGSGTVKAYSMPVGGSPTLKATLISPNSGANRYFGVTDNSQGGATPLQCNNIGDLLIVGERAGINSLSAGTGTVHLFQVTDTQSTLLQTLEAPLEFSSGSMKFGTSVSLSGDELVLAIGAPEYDDSGVKGAAQVFKKVNSVFTFDASIKSFIKQTGERTGRTLALNTEGNTLFLGCPERDDGATSAAGAVEVRDLVRHLVFDNTIKNLSGVFQGMDRLNGTSTLGAISFDLIDYGGEITEYFRGKLANEQGLRHKVAKFYRGYPGLDFADYVQFGTQIVEKVSQGKSGSIQMQYIELLALKKSKIFEIADTNLAADVLVADAEIEVFNTIPFGQVEHGPQYKEAPSYATGTVSVTNGSKVVTGSGTSWLVQRLGFNARISIDEVFYTIDRIHSATSLDLVEDYQNDTASGLDYVAYPFLFYFEIDTEIINATGRVLEEVSNTSTGYGFALDGSDWYISGMSEKEQYLVGCRIEITGSTVNDGTYVVHSKNFASRLYITETFTTEAAGDTVNILAPIQFFDCERGAKGSTAAAYNITPGALPSRQPALKEIAYLTMPGPMLALALITGNVYNQSQKYEFIVDDFSELHTFANAANILNEANNTTGFVPINSVVLTSVSSPVSGGFYALSIESNTTPTLLAGIYVDLSVEPFNLVSGLTYKLTIAVRHNGTGGEWQVSLDPTTTGASILIDKFLSTDTTYQSYELVFKYSAAVSRYITIREINASNDGGVYVDELSIKRTNQLISDGGFLGGSTGYWTLETDWAVVGGTANCGGSGFGTQIYQSPPWPDTGTVIVFSFEILSVTWGTAAIVIGGSGAESAEFGTVGIHTYTYTVVGTETTVGIRASGASSFFGEIDDVSMLVSDAAGTSILLPASYHMGILERYVDISSFENVGDDVWNLWDQSGIIAEVFEKEATEGKRFLEKEIYRILGAITFVSDEGKITYKQLNAILFDSATVGRLDKTNAIFGDITHEMPKLSNRYVFDWDHDPVSGDPRERNIVIDQTSINIHQGNKVLHYALKTISRDIHSIGFIYGRFDSLRDAYSGPPVLANIQALPSQDKYQIGDVVFAESEDVRDFTSETGTLARAVEIEKVSMDFSTGKLNYEVFGSSRKAGLISNVLDEFALADTFYSVAGGLLAANKLDAIASLTTSVDGQGVLHITAATAVVNLPGHVSDGSLAIYWYDGPVQIDTGVTVTVDKNFRLYIMGQLFMPSGAKIDGKGGAGIGTEGYIGASEAGGGMNWYSKWGTGNDFDNLYYYLTAVRGDLLTSATLNMPYFNVVNSAAGTILTGLPSNLTGLVGDTGGAVFDIPRLKIDATGGLPGNAGAGLTLLCRGVVISDGGSIDLSGDDGSLGGVRTSPYAPRELHAGSGAGGYSGGLLVLLDGKGSFAVGVDNGFIADSGATPISGIVMATAQEDKLTALAVYNKYSFYTGESEGVSHSQSNLRIQKIPDST